MCSCWMVLVLIFFNEDEVMNSVIEAFICKFMFAAEFFHFMFLKSDNQFANSFCLDRDPLMSSRLHLKEESTDEEKYDGSAEKKGEDALDSVSQNGGLQTTDDFGNSNDFTATKTTMSGLVLF